MLRSFLSETSWLMAITYMYLIKLVDNKAYVKSQMSLEFGYTIHCALELHALEC